MLKNICLFVAGVLLSSISVAHALDSALPIRENPRPQTTRGVPHVQIGIEINQALANELLNYVASFPGVTLGPTRVSLPGAIGFQLDNNMDIARPRSIVGGLEFAHLHPDGSLHASLDPLLAKEAVKAGWAIAHPWALQRPGWDGFVMIYTPTTSQELEVVSLLVAKSYEYIVGKSVSQ